MSPIDNQLLQKYPHLKKQKRGGDSNTIKDFKPLKTGLETNITS